MTRLGRIGAVNMLAVEEHAEESARLEFLDGQREDLEAARNDLRAAIRRINATATELFMTSFEAIRENFRRTFERLFSGGEATLRLSDPEDPLESRVEIHAAPGGKRTQRIDLLSGGERALTALSLLFGIYLVKPSPFCVLDEGGRPARRVQHRSLHPHARGLQGRDPVRRDHAQSPDHRGGGLDLRRDDGRAGRFVHRRRAAGGAGGHGGVRPVLTVVGSETVSPGIPGREPGRGGSKPREPVDSHTANQSIR